MSGVSLKLQIYKMHKRGLFYYIALKSKIINPNGSTKSMRVRIRLTIIITFFYISCFAQDPEFSQFYSNQLYYNPAFAGIKGGPRFILDFRDQWPSLPAAYVTYTASYDQFFDKIRSGIGFIVMGDNQGDGIYNSYTADAIYSYQIKITENFNLNIGLQGGYFERTINWADAIFADQLNPLNPFILSPTGEQIVPTKVSGPDAGAGLLAYSKHVYFGLGVEHLLSSREAFTSSDATGTIPMRISGNLGYEVSSEKNVNHNVFFSPNLIYIQQAGQYQLNVGTYFGITPLFIGMYYREAFTNPDAFIILVGFTQGIFKIAYSYDITVSQLNNGNTGGAHEVTLIINLADKFSATNDARNTYKHEMQCPNIF
jgi:type IX secretion system PorP/SprF family membrane protein